MSLLSMAATDSDSEAVGSSLSRVEEELTPTVLAAFQRVARRGAKAEAALRPVVLDGLAVDRYYRQALAQKPGVVNFHNNLATALKQQGRFAEAVAQAVITPRMLNSSRRICTTPALPWSQIILIRTHLMI